MLHHPHRLRRQVLTYGELGRLIGYSHVGVIGRFLGPIMAYCG
jgi:alkylated DNA nucleotide flippase Atl1